jgi:hypothetical protein
MRILAIMLALVAVLGHRPEPTAPAPVEAAEVWHVSLPEATQLGLDDPQAFDSIILGAQEIPLGSFEPIGEADPDDD